MFPRVNHSKLMVVRKCNSSPATPAEPQVKEKLDTKETKLMYVIFFFNILQKVSKVHNKDLHALQD